MNKEQAINIISKCGGFSDSTSNAGEAWEYIQNYIEKIESDHIEENQAALIFNPDNTINLLLPKHKEEDNLDNHEWVPFVLMHLFHNDPEVIWNVINYGGGKLVKHIQDQPEES
jgi:hypothetical protein